MNSKSKNRDTLMLETVPGYRFSALAAGIKSQGRLDLGLISSDVPATAVACFTSNRIQAAPVLQGKSVLKSSSKLKAVVVNSGNANAATGERGLKNAFKCAERVAKLLGVPEDQILVSSTGKIGQPLDMPKLLAALPPLVQALDADAAMEFSGAILTTDRFPKLAQFIQKSGDSEYHVTGIAKGAGMIEPHMATMLAYVLTDVQAPRPALQKLFSGVVEKTFNAISVDGDQSTNDTALLLANGSSGVKLKPDTPEWAQFARHLEQTCEALARAMVRDGEGATKVVELCVEGASTSESARRLAYSVARSLLVKTSFFGEDPNWGRVLAALGYAGEALDPEQVEIHYGPIAVVRKGVGTSPQNEAKAQKVMQGSEFTLRIKVGQGQGRARLWTSDLGLEYIKINSEYRT